MNSSIPKLLELLGPLYHLPSERHRCLYAAIGIRARELHYNQDPSLTWIEKHSLRTAINEWRSNLAFRADCVLENLASQNTNSGLSAFLRYTAPFSFEIATSAEHFEPDWLEKCFEVVVEEFNDKDTIGDLFSELISECFSGRYQSTSLFEAGNHALNELVSSVITSAYKNINNPLIKISDPCSGLGDLIYRTANKLGIYSNISAYEFSRVAAKIGSIAAEVWGLPLSPPHPQDTFTDAVYDGNPQDIIIADIPSGTNSTRSQFGVLSGENHWDWIKRIVDGLSANGLAFVIVPRKLIERSNLADISQRQELLNRNMLRAVLHFRFPLRAHSNSESVLLILGRPLTSRGVLLVDWTPEKEYSQLHKVLNEFFTIQRLLSECNWAKVCTVDELLQEDSNLVPLRRLPLVPSEIEPSLPDAQQQLIESAQQLSQAERSFNQAFEALNNL